MPRRTWLLSGVLVLLLAAAGLTVCGTAATVTSNVTVSLTDAGVTASQEAFVPGAHCHFVVTNHGTQSHQFWLMPQDMPQRMHDMPMAQWRQQLLYSSQTIAPGQTVSFDYTFPMMSGNQQALAFGCYTERGQSVAMMPIQFSGS